MEKQKAQLLDEFWTIIQTDPTPESDDALDKWNEKVLQLYEKE